MAPAVVESSDPVDRMRAAESAAHASYLAALNAREPNDGDIEQRQRRWERLTEQLRKAELSQQEMSIKKGDLVPLSEVRAEFATMCSSLVAMRKSMARRVADRVPGLSGELRLLVMTAIEEVRAVEDAIFRNDVKWMPPDELPTAA